MRGKVKIALLFLGLFTVIFSTASTAPQQAEALTKPNILLIMTDDQDYRSVRQMPHVRADLARKGTSFTNAFASTSLCCPSRATFLRGQYEHNHGVLTNSGPEGGYAKFRRLGHERSTVATWAHGGGYRTVLLGKYLNEYEGRRVPPGWGRWYARTHGLTKGRTAFQLNQNGKLVDYPLNKYHATDVLRDLAVRYIRNGERSDERPFFMYLAVKAPHNGPMEVAPRHEKKFADKRLPRPPNFNERDISDKPRWVQGRERLTSGQIRGLTSHYRERLRSLQAVDEMVAKLIDTLRKTGELRNTYIVFASDNGYHLGEHRLDHGKGTPYEESVRIPFIVRGPGVAQDRQRTHMVLNNDFAPTVADLAGVSTPRFVDGKSIRPLLRTNTPTPAEWRDQVLIEHLGRFGSSDYRAVRTQTAKYVKYTTGEEELYDLTDDRYELRSLHKTDPALLSDMQARLERLKGCAGAACRTAENP